MNWGPEWFGEDYIRCDVTSSVRVEDELAFKVKADDEIPLVLGQITLPIGTTGFFVEGNIFLKIKYAGSVEGTFSSTLQKRYGFIFNSDDGYQDIDESSISDVSAMVNTKIVASAGAGAELSITFVELIRAALSGEVGLKADAEIDPTSSSNMHSCYLCIDGNLSKYGNISFAIKVGVGQLSITPIEFELLNSEKPYSSFYCSLLNSGASLSFGLGQCPNKRGSIDNPDIEDVPFAGGTGTAEDPYQVANAQQLNAVRNNFDAYYIQIQDITLAAYNNWNPIDSENSYSLGGYDGNGYTISDLTITNLPNKDRICIGLFGSISRKFIKNVTLSNVDINLVNNKNNDVYAVGSIVGELYTGSIENCHVLSGRIQYLTMEEPSILVGGIVGDGFAPVENCSNKADILVTGQQITCGGIGGNAYNITNCVNFGALELSAKGSVECGGIVGDDYGELINYCINYGDVTEKATIDDSGNRHSIGGIVGEMTDTPVRNCINYGSISQEITRLSNMTLINSVGGIVGVGGDLYGERTKISDCYNLAKTISSIEINMDHTSRYSLAKRILGRHWSASDSISWGGCELKEVFSTNTVLNGGSASDELLSFGIQNARNGQTLSEDEMKEKIQPILQILGLDQTA